MVDLTQRGIKNIIRYSGLKDLNLQEQTILKNIAETEYERIHRMLSGNVMDLLLNVKVHEKGGKKKYSVHTKIVGASDVITSEAFGWDIKTVTRDSIIKLGNNIKKQFKEEGRKWPRGMKELIRRFWNK
ncbi:MAG: hypothetical protein PHD81_01165 [Candidatus Nanoarchaeia archaeon]|nr:hypothetical protein [Candidatus Nanoarchaeia archaeon]MDD5587700.1 hypothetical protein [Candidatus Nanoarchaeia archaeon]